VKVRPAGQQPSDRCSVARHDARPCRAQT
jgi:hypothetical protein